MGDVFGRYSNTSFKSGPCRTFGDGLKPVQRRILYSMNKDGNTSDKGYRKSAKSVGTSWGISTPR